MKCPKCDKELMLESFFIDTDDENQRLVNMFHCEKCNVVLNKEGVVVIEVGKTNQ
jgi:phage FluMu protein Com